MKRIILATVVIMVIAGATAYIASDYSKPEAQVRPAERAVAIDAVSGNARVFSAVDLILKSEAKGRVIETCAAPRSGPMMVEAGDIIVQLDPTRILQEIESVNIQLDSARDRSERGSPLDSQIKNAEESFDLYQQLADANQFPQAELDVMRRDLEALYVSKDHETIDRDRQIATLENHLDKLNTTLERLSIRSPMDGYVTEIFTPIGDLVFDGTHVARIISKERVVEVTISEEDFQGIKPGQPVTLRLLGQGNRLYSGSVDVLLAEGDPNTKRRSIYIDVDVPQAELIPGMTGQASITKDERADALVVPRRALLGENVFVVKNGIVEVKSVQPGFLSLNLAEIQSGLQEGELVIVETPHIYRDGDHVNIMAN